MPLDIAACWNRRGNSLVVVNLGAHSEVKVKIFQNGIQVGAEVVKTFTGGGYEAISLRPAFPPQAGDHAVVHAWTNGPGAEEDTFHVPFDGVEVDLTEGVPLG